MKKLFLIGIITFQTLSVFGQVKIDDNNFIGHWISEGTTVDTFIWKDKNGKFQILEFDRETGEKLETSILKTSNNSINVKSVFYSNNHKSNALFTLNSEDEMVAVISRDATDRLIYKKQ
jgi:hypothetical protein